MTGLWFLPARPLRLNSNEWMNEWLQWESVWSGFVWIMIRINCELLWRRWWIFLWLNWNAKSCFTLWQTVSFYCQRVASLSDRMSVFTAAWRKLGIRLSREEWVYKTTIFRVRGHTGWGVFLGLYLRGGRGRVGPFRRKWRYYLHVLQEAEGKRPASCDWEGQYK